MDFDMLGLAPRLIAALARQGITDPTPIQAQAIPHAMNGRDVMGLAQTGTGKTAAFGLPLIHALSARGAKPAPKTVGGLVLAPTRELAKQIADTLRDYVKGSHLSVALVTGGASLGRQISQLERGTDLLIATPGRLIDLLDRRALTLGQTQFLVLDEADQMLDLGFIHALRRIAPLLPADRQTMLFSATMPKGMAEIAGAYLRNPVRVEVARPGQTADRIDQSVRFVPQGEKVATMVELLDSHRGDRSLVFARTKHGAERLMKQLVAAGYGAASIHGNKSQGQRDRAMAGFRDGSVRILVATDVAARGIDVQGVEYVYNFDLPNVAEIYTHRIGRTARAGASGIAVSLCAPDEMGELRAIEKMTGQAIAVAAGRPWEAPRAEKPGAGKAGKPGGARRRRPQGRGGYRQAA